jgi:localization factor PodJL
MASPINTRPLEEALRGLHDRLDRAPTAKVDTKFVEQAADLFTERLERRDGARVDADALASQISAIHDRLDALQADAASNIAVERKLADLVADLEATRRALQSLPMSGRDGEDIADGLADLRAEHVSADKRTQARLASLQDILERLVGRLGRVEDEVARVDESARTATFDELRDAPRSPLAKAPEPPAMSSAALRDIPDRLGPRPARDGKPSLAGAAPPLRSIEGADFLIEPSARPRSPEAGDLAPPKSAVNAHIAAARRAAQAAMDESKDRKAGSPGAPAETVAGAREALAGQARAFLAARRRPLLLGATLLALIATFAIVELRGARQVPTQKTDLESPARVSPKPEPSKVGELSDGVGAAGIDASPVGSIAAPPASAKTGRTAPADLVAALPAGLSPTLRDAAAAGDANAQFELGLRFIEGRSVAKDPHVAAQWFAEAAAHDLPIAQYRLAALYEKGIGVARDAQLAMSWYAKAANAGNARAMHNLAVMNAEGGAGGKPDYAEAAQWFHKAGLLGVRDSQFNLGILYARGMGVPQDLVQSWLWFSLAAQQGDTDAGKKRDDVAAKMDAQALLAAAKALAAFQVAAPAPAANEAATPPSGWDAKTGSAQATPGHGGATTL